jgi:hypothetical protein
VTLHDSAVRPYLSPRALLHRLDSLAMAVAGVIIWRAKGRHDWRIGMLTALGLLAALLHFSALLSLANGLDCGL